MTLMMRPMKVRVLGEMRERARPLTIFCSSQPLPLPNARVQVIDSSFYCQVERRLDTSLRGVDIDYSATLTVSWMVASLRISSSRLPLGVTTVAVSPISLLSRARPIGEVVEMRPLVTSDSSLVTSL